MFTEIAQASKESQISLSDEVVSGISLFGALTESQCEFLIGCMSQRQCPWGERVFCQGDLPSNIYVVLKGRVDLVVENEGLLRIAGSFKPGDAFGESAVIGIQAQVGTAIVSGNDTTLLVLTREALIRIQRADPELYGILMMNIARDLGRKLHASISA